MQQVSGGRVQGVGWWWRESVWRVMGVVERGSSAAWTLGRFWGASQSFSDSGTRASGPMGTGAQTALEPEGRRAGARVGGAKG